jgi:hypothetical protein
VSIDGGLRQIFRTKFRDYQWTSIETGAVSPGTPDAEYCAPGGLSGWVEFKKTSGWKVEFRPLQVPWIHRRARLGGRVFIAVRRKKDELYLISGADVLELEEKGVKNFVPIAGVGSRNWDWNEVEQILLGRMDSVTAVKDDR